MLQASWALLLACELVVQACNLQSAGLSDYQLAAITSPQQFYGDEHTALVMVVVQALGMFQMV